MKNLATFKNNVLPLRCETRIAACTHGTYWLLLGFSLAIYYIGSINPTEYPLLPLLGFCFSILQLLALHNVQSGSISGNRAGQTQQPVRQNASIVILDAMSDGNEMKESRQRAKPHDRVLTFFNPLRRHCKPNKEKPRWIVRAGSSSIGKVKGWTMKNNIGLSIKNILLIKSQSSNTCALGL